MKYENTKEIKIVFQKDIAIISIANEDGDDMVQYQIAMDMPESKRTIVRCVIELLLSKDDLLFLAAKEFGKSL